MPTLEQNLDAGDYAASNMLNTDAGQILANILAASITCIQFVQKNGFYSKLDFFKDKSVTIPICNINYLGFCNKLDEEISVWMQSRYDDYGISATLPMPP